MRSPRTARSSIGSPPAIPTARCGRCAPTSRTSRSTGAGGPRRSEPVRGMTVLRRLDHVAVAVRDTDDALHYFRDRLGLEGSRSEEIESPHVRLTYLDPGNAYIQLVEPLDPH